MAVDYDGRPVADKRLFDAQARCAKLDDFGKRFANHQDGCAVRAAREVMARP